MKLSTKMPGLHFHTLLKISPLSKPPTIPATMATGLYNNLSIAASLHLVTAQLAMSAPAVNTSLAPGPRWPLIVRSGDLIRPGPWAAPTVPSARRP